LQGEGVENWLGMATYWFQKAADQGYAEAQCRLGSCYDQGKGVPQNKEKAKYWYKRAAEQGHQRAQLSLSLSN
jgi:TPR repeat protein